MRATVTAERLREFLAYDPETGLFTYLRTRGGKMPGMVAGTTNNGGYTIISVDDRAYSAHRLVWLHVHGEWPDGTIDHLNGIKTDNRLSNLRDVPMGINTQNQRRPNRRNTTGFMGVSFKKKEAMYVAQIRVNREHIYIGSFKKAEDAYEAYLQAKRRLHPGCTI
jgi:hypothetical protein